MDDQWRSRAGELLLQSFLAAQVLMPHHESESEIFRKFLEQYGILLDEIEIHIIEENTLGQNQVVIGTFFLRFRRSRDGGTEKVWAQGLITVKIDRKGEVVVKFTSPTYQFMIRMNNPNLSGQAIRTGGNLMEIYQMPRDLGKV